MMEEEAACFSFLEEEKPAYAAQFLRFIPHGRYGILHKLASAVLREGLYEHSTDVKTEGDKNIQKVIRFADYSIVFPVKSTHAFNRVETYGDIIRIDDKEERVIRSASELADHLFDKEEYPNLPTFKEELDNGTANLTLAYAARSLKGAGEETGSLFYEQQVVEGHHLHPGAKTKLGLSYRDVFRYSPEFAHTFPLRFVAVRKDFWQSREPDIIRHYYPAYWNQAMQELEERNREQEDFVIVPVHEWQFFQAIPSIYEEEIERGIVVLLEDVKLEVKATSSFRTVVPVSEQGPALKLAVNSQMTSTVRSISPQTAGNACVVTGLIRDIFKEDSFPSFRPLYELGGGSFRSEDSLKKRNLTMLVREDIDPYIAEKEQAVAGMALYAEVQPGKGTVLQSLVREYRENRRLTKKQGALSFFRTYAETVLPPYLTLMTKYGIALEGHLQNSVPVFQKGELTRFFFRDWGGARFYTRRLSARGYRPEFMEGSVSVADDLSSMHHKLYYTVFQNHLGEIIRQLTMETEVEEDVFWRIVREICDRVYKQLEQEVPREAGEDYEFLTRKTVMHKSLTKMRLLGEKEDGFSEVPNPLNKGEEEWTL
ncbi:IucA/IucC family protein [Salimicrobium sp. PL1-032A]|uniref:IucA/IucC family protein n=1 Tax=Salimicrobium sp. PL1-032A TaxID=3095364 RepID=UPI003260DFA9